MRPRKPTRALTNTDSRAWNISSVSRPSRDGHSSDWDRGSWGMMNFRISLEEAERYDRNRQTCDVSFIIAFSYFVISLMIWHHLLPIIMSIVIKRNMQLSVALQVIYRFGHMVVLTLWWFVRNTKKCVGLVHFRSHAFFKKMWSQASTVSRLQAVFNLLKKQRKKKTKTNKNKKYIFWLKNQHAFEKK